MKHVPPLLSILLAAACLAPVQAQCQVHAQLGPAAILEQDVRLGIFGIAGDDQVGALADSRFLLTLGLDLGIQAGFRRLSDAGADQTVFDGGVDLRYGVVESLEDAELDVSVGGGFGFTVGDDLTVLTAVVQGAVSTSLSTSRGRQFTPYAGLALSIAHVKVDIADVEDRFADPDLDVILRLGLDFGLSATTTLTGELQIKEELAAYLGLTTSF